MIYRFVLIGLLVFTLCFPTHLVLAAERQFSLSEEVLGNSGSEFVSGKTPGAVLMRVNLWGGVRKPGIHHIPVGTNLVTLLSYAGGPENDAELDNVVIKRLSPEGKQETLKCDVEEMVDGNGTKIPTLNVNDIIVVPQTKTVVSANTLTTLSVIATLASILVTGLLVAKQTGK